ncbi:MAG: molybdopterin-dependent oxidoreductase, partial [Pseudomonadota bacterium]
VEDADALFLVGTNPRVEAAVWNARIRKAWLWNELKVFVIGEASDLTYDYTHLGSDPSAIAEIAKQSGFEKPMVVVGEGALAREDGAAIHATANEAAHSIGAIKEDWAGFGVLHTAAGRVGALDTGFLPGEGGADTAGILGGGMDAIVLFGADEVDLSRTGNAKIIYIGSHGDAGASKADIILPSAAYTEMAATYVNTEGRVQMTRRAVQPKGEAREGWAILRALSDVLGKKLPYDSADDLRAALREANPVFAGLGYAPGHEGAEALKEKVTSGGSSLGSAPFTAAIGDFYMTNPIARASKTMAECSLQKQGLETPMAAE